MSNDKVAATFHGGAETLRRAATSMRERAAAATPGPWISVAETHQDHGGADTYSHVLTADERTYVGQPDTAPDAEHIASWHPLVALAVADWLDADATVMERHGLDATISKAFAVAIAYLGDQS